MNVWYPKAQKLPFAHPSGGSMIGGPARGVLHTTEVFTYTPSTDSYYGHLNPPHITLDTQQAIFYQHYPFNVAARALRNAAGGVQTNRQGSVNVQIEIAWKAAQIRDLPDPSMNALRQFMIWCRDELGIPFETHVRFVGSEAYGLQGTVRMAPGVWTGYTGWCGHQHVPENTHWDPGKVDTEILFVAPPPPGLGDYVDRADWPTYAAASIQKAIDKNVIVGSTVNGQKVWRPAGTVTRDMLAVILDRLGLLEE